RGRFLFTRLIFCGHCGSPMHGATNQKPHVNKRGQLLSDRKLTYRRYICGRYNSHGKLGCRCNTISERQLLRAVLRRVQEDFLDPGNRAKLEEKLRQKLRAGGSAAAAQAQRLKERLADLEKKIDQGNESYLTAPQALREGLATKLLDWQQQKQQAS